MCKILSMYSCHRILHLKVQSHPLYTCNMVHCCTVLVMTWPSGERPMGNETPSVLCSERGTVLLGLIPQNSVIKK